MLVCVRSYRESRFSGLGRQSLSFPFGACSGSKFVVSRAGEAYDAPVREPKRKFRFNWKYNQVGCSPKGGLT